MSDQLSPRLRQALQLVFELHGDEARKESPVPVLAHLLAVCAIVQQDGGDEDEAIAALLHDTLEDKPVEVPPEEIERRFGSRVLQLVRVGTDVPEDFRGGPKPKWKERKLKYLALVGGAGPSMLRVTVADKIDNVRAILADYRRLGESLWSRFNAPKGDQLWYYRSALEAYRSAAFKGPLLDELDRLVTILEEAAGARDEPMRGSDREVF